jgi:hypothetical protein
MEVAACSRQRCRHASLARLSYSIFLSNEWALEKTRAMRPWLQVVPGVWGIECITSFAPEKRMGSTLNLLHNIIEAACITKSNITLKILRFSMSIIYSISTQSTDFISRNFRHLLKLNPGLILMQFRNRTSLVLQ